MIDFLVSIFALCLCFYGISSFFVDTTKFEYWVVCKVNSLYNWFKKLFKKEE
jgi:hypothetical protein